VHQGAAVALVGGALGVFTLTGTALAQAPFEQEAPPGVTVTGLGLASVSAPSRPNNSSIQRAIAAAQPVAVAHAVRDARERAAAIATAHQVALGPVDKVELNDSSSPFAPTRLPCRRHKRTEPRICRVPRFTSALATVTFSIVGGGTGSEGAREVSAYGSASTAVRPKNRRSSAAIRRAMFASRRHVIPGALAAARRSAASAAHSSGVTLGNLVSIAEQPQVYFPYDLSLGTFGTGQFCGTGRPAIFNFGVDSGGRGTTRRAHRRRCSFPSALSLRLEATYEAG
jgi:hypothetical protein